jgi:hypothetical protein
MEDALPPAADGEDEYYSAVRSVLLTVLVLLATHIGALVYTRRSTPDDEVCGFARQRRAPKRMQRGCGAAEALALTRRHHTLHAQGRDSVSLLLCALTHGLTWARAALLLFVLGGQLETPPRAAGVASFGCQWLITPFAYLYHEAVGVGYAWGASGVASRAAEAAAVLALLAVLLLGTLSLLSALSPASGAHAAEGGLAGVSGSFFAVPDDASASPALDRLLLLAGLVETIVSFARGAVHPLLPPACGADAVAGVPPTANGPICGDGPRAWSAEWDAGWSRTYAATHSLLAEPLPARGLSARLASARRLSARQAVRLLASVAWVGLWAAFVLMVALRVVELVRLSALSLPLDPPAPLTSEDRHADRAGWHLPRRPPPAPAGRALSLVLVLASVVGHHLLCRVQLRHVRRRPGGTPLQLQLVEAAALQVQAAAIPVAGHALGIAPRAAAAACTPMPLYSSPLGAALFCAGFLAVNLLAAGLLVRRWGAGPSPPSRLLGAGRDTSPERLWTER